MFLLIDLVRRQSLKVLNSRDVVISGLTSVDSELYHVVIDGCEGVTVQDVQIVAPGSSPNTDGIHVQASSQVTVTRTSIQTGDDCGHQPHPTSIEALRVIRSHHDKIHIF